MLQCSSSFYHLDLRNVFRCVNGFLKRIFKYLDKCLKWVRSNLDKTSLLGVTDFVVQIGHSFSRIEVSFQYRGFMGD